MKVPGPGEYIFAVTGLRADGKTAPESATVRFKVEQPSTLSMARRWGLRIFCIPRQTRTLLLRPATLLRMVICLIIRLKFSNSKIRVAMSSTRLTRTKIVCTCNCGWRLTLRLLLEFTPCM